MTARWNQRERDRIMNYDTLSVGLQHMYLAC